jgi:hypothetical protein
MIRPDETFYRLLEKPLSQLATPDKSAIPGKPGTAANKPPATAKPPVPAAKPAPAPTKPAVKPDAPPAKSKPASSAGTR